MEISSKLMVYTINSKVDCLENVSPSMQLLLEY